MAINPTKLLPPSGGALAVRSKTIDIGKKKDGGIEGQVLVIRTQVIKIEKLITRGYTLKLKEQKEERKENEDKKRAKKEEELETKKPPKEGKGKIPALPKLGFLDRIRKFIGNMLLAYFAVRLIDHLPKLIPFVKAVGNVAEFLIDVGGGILNGLVSFIDWGYKAYDATRGFIKNLGGENFAKVFDGFNGAIGTLVETAIITAVTLSSFGGGDGGGPGGGRGGYRNSYGGGKKGLDGDFRRGRFSGYVRGFGVDAPEVGGGVQGHNLWKQQAKGGALTDAGLRKAENNLMKRYFQKYGRDAFVQRFGQEGLERLPGGMARSAATKFARNAFVGLAGKGGAKAILGTVRPLLKRLPIVGALIDFGLSVALGEDPGRAAFKAIGAGLFGSIGTAIGSLAFGFGGIVGGILGSIGGDAIGGALYDVLFGNKKPQQKKQKVQGKAGGGITRGGKRMGAIRRTGGVSGKGKIKRKTKIAQKPGEVEFKSPGADIGGKDKILGIFPAPQLKTVEDSGKNLGKTDYFGPILAISSKITLGQKPTTQDYKNAGLGINLLFSEGVNKGEIVGGIAAAYAEGGFVDKKTLDAVSEGSDITNWVARAFKGAVETNAQKTLREIREKSNKARETSQLSTPGFESRPGDTNGEFSPGSVPGGQMTMEQLVGLAKGAGFSDSEAVTMAAIAKAESGGNSNARNFKPPDKSYGLWQINMIGRLGPARMQEFGLQREDQLFDPVTNAKAAYAIRKSQGLSAWTVYKTGKYKNYLSDAQAARNAPSLRVSPSIDSKIDQSGLPSLPPTGTMSGQNYGDSRRGGRQHAGQDYDISGNQKFYSRIGGEVVNIGYDPGGYGNYVDIYNKQLNVTERIAEGARILVSRGSNVTKGQAVTQGESETGVIHYEIRQGRNTTFGFSGTLDPKKFLGKASAFHGENFGVVPKDGFTLKLHKGEMYKVIDKDSVDLLGFDLTKEIIDIENKSQLIAKAPSIIEKLKAISGYASYESEAPQTVIVQDTPEQDSYQDPMIAVIGGVGGGGDSYDPFAMLDRLSG